MICLIRIKGKVGLRKEIIETLDRLRLRKKYSCIVLGKPSQAQLGMIKKMRDFVALGELNKETLVKLVEARAKSLDKTKKIDAKKIVEGIEQGKKYEELGIKPFFSLHPPRGGIDSKLHYPKGVLGDHKNKINELVERML